MFLFLFCAFRRINLHFIFVIVYIDNPKSLKPTIMRKNIQFVVVLFFVTLAFLVMLNDVTNNRNPENQNSVELYEANNQSDLATTDLEDLE